MLTSNKILLGLLISIIAVFTITHATVYSKNKKGEIIPNNLVQEKYEKEKFIITNYSAFTNIKIENANDITIKYGTDYRVLIDKSEASNVKLKQIGDTISISSNARNKRYRFGQTDESIIVYCPTFTNVEIKEGSASIVDLELQQKLTSYFLTNAELIFGHRNAFNEFESQIHKSKFKNVNVNLFGSSALFVSSMCTIELLNINANNTSRIVIDKVKCIDSVKTKIGDSCRLEIPAKFLPQFQNK
jgi:hypothetical protein